MKKLLLILLLVSSPIFAQHITATSWLVADGEGRVIESVNAAQQRSIASITKLMTVIVVLDAQQNLDEVLRNKLTRRQLISLAIVKSDNNAAKVLCEKYPTGLNGCVEAMNHKAQTLGMTNTNAPIVVKDKVLTGISGGEFGVRGFLAEIGRAHV